MNGTVKQLKPRGYLAEMDSETDGVPAGTVFETYRVVDGAEIVVGRGVSRKTMPERVLKVNPDDGMEFGEPQVGDLVRSV